MEGKTTKGQYRAIPKHLSCVVLSVLYFVFSSACNYCSMAGDIWKQSCSAFICSLISAYVIAARPYDHCLPFLILQKRFATPLLQGVICANKQHSRPHLHIPLSRSQGENRQILAKNCLCCFRKSQLPQHLKDFKQN